MKQISEYQPTVEQVMASRWSELIASCLAPCCEQYTEAFFKVRQECEKNSDAVGEDVYGLLAAVTFLHLNLEDAANPFWPTDHLTEFTDSQLSLFRELFNLTTDADLKARLADVLAMKAKLHPHGLNAIDNYWLAIERLVEQGCEYVTWKPRFERMLQLVCRLNRGPAYYQRVADFCRLKTSGPEQNVGNLQDKLDEILNMLDLMHKYEVVQSDEIVGTAEKWCALAEKSGDWFRAVFYWEFLDKLTRTDTNSDRSKSVRKRLAVAYERCAALLIADNPPRYQAATLWMLKARELLRLLKADQEELKRVYDLLCEYQRRGATGNSARVTQIDITDIVQKVLALVSGKDFHDALFEISRMIGPLNKDAMREKARRFFKNSPPIVVMSTRQLLGKNGKVVATGRGLSGDDVNSDDVIADEIIRLSVQQRAFVSQAYISPAFRCLVSEHIFRPDDLLPLLTYSSFVPPGREEIFAKGLYYGLNGDLMLAAHLLAPQVENSIRIILCNAGCVDTIVKKATNEVEIYKTLGALLWEPKATEVFGEDLVFDLMSLLSEQYGSNLRNDIAHGLLDATQFQTATVQYFVWLTLHLCLNPVIEIQRQQAARAAESAVATMLDVPGESSPSTVAGD